MAIALKIGRKFDHCSNGSDVVLTVTDQGRGIELDKLEEIFERFYTDRPAGSAFGNNSGLGLSIVAQIVETHMGTVVAANRDAGGARFTIELPAI